MGQPGDDAEEVLRAIRRIVRRIAEHSRALSRDAGLTVPQLLCLRAVGQLGRSQAGDVTVMRLSQHVQLGPPTVSRIVERLVQAGLVVRERGASDRRKVSLSLSEAGLRRFESLPRPLQETFVAQFEALTPQRRSELLDALAQVGRMMEATELDVAPVLTPGLELRGDESGEAGEASE